jgi:hypothetical protein
MLEPNNGGCDHEKVCSRNSNRADGRELCHCCRPLLQGSRRGAGLQLDGLLHRWQRWRRVGKFRPDDVDCVQPRWLFRHKQCPGDKRGGDSEQQTERRYGRFRGRLQLENTQFRPRRRRRHRSPQPEQQHEQRRGISLLRSYGIHGDVECQHDLACDHSRSPRLCSQQLVVLRHWWRRVHRSSRQLRVQRHVCQCSRISLLLRHQNWVYGWRRRRGGIVASSAPAPPR